MSSKSKIFSKGFIEVSPHFLSVMPFGVIFGAIGIELGFGPYITYATSIIIFGGASQIAFLQLISGGASALIAITSVAVINSRHILYGAVLSEYLDKIIKSGQKILSVSIDSELRESTLADELSSIQKKYLEVDIGSYPYFKEKPGTVLVLRSIKEDKLKMCEKEVRALIKKLS